MRILRGELRSAAQALFQGLLFLVPVFRQELVLFASAPRTQFAGGTQPTVRTSVFLKVSARNRKRSTSARFFWLQQDNFLRRLSQHSPGEVSSAWLRRILSHGATTQTRL